MAVQTLKFYDLPTRDIDVTSEVLSGLSQVNKQIAPKYFYDEIGSQLFTEITRQPEYYPTRTEIGLLRSLNEDLVTAIGRNVVLIEYGSGNSEKIRVLLENLRPSLYAPIDISREYLAQSVESLRDEYDWLNVEATCIDYSQDFDLPIKTKGRRVGFFPGSSIGNFDPDQAVKFLKRVRGHVGSDGGLLIGVDLKKNHDVLNSAYNDRAGITGRFNLNILAHLNTELAGNFELVKFRHEAGYNAQKGCIEMFLVSEVAQEVELAGQVISFQAGEKIHTENSFKYSSDDFIEMAVGAGFSQHHFWTDERCWFGLFYLYSA